MADRLAAAGQPVSLRSVILLLRHGGSHRDVGPLPRGPEAGAGLQAPAGRGYLPEALHGQPVGFVHSVWEAAQADASGRLAEERERIEAERSANEGLRNEALGGAVEGLGAQNAAMRGDMESREGQAAELEERIRKLNVSELRDRDMRETAELLPLDAGRTAAQALRELPPSLVWEAERYREPLTPGEINNKKTVRAEKGRYLIRGEAGRFTRKPPRCSGGSGRDGWTGKAAGQGG